jgi:hypothetical protein
MVTFTRTQLHEAVWSRPLNDIIREHGVPYEEIVRACKLMQIPRPKPGYWRIKSIFEEPPPPPPLPVAPTAPIEATLRLRIPRPKRPAEVGDRVPTSEVEHSLIVATRKAMARARPGPQGLVSPHADRRALTICVSEPMVERALGIYTKLIRALQGSSAALEVCPAEGQDYHETWVLVGGERFGIELVERLTIVDHEPDPPMGEDGYRWWAKRRELHPTGRLALRLLGLEGTGTRQRWEDTPTCSLEDKVDGIPVALTMAAERVRARREERERWHRERERERLAAAAVRRERLRRDALVRQALQMFRQWRTAREFAVFLDEVERLVPEEHRGEAFMEAMALARMHLQDIDPLGSPERVVEALTRPDEREWAQELDLGLVRPLR